MDEGKEKEENLDFALEDLVKWVQDLHQDEFDCKHQHWLHLEIQLLQTNPILWVYILLKVNNGKHFNSKIKYLDHGNLE